MFKFLDKIADWLPNRRETMNNKIDAIKKEMENVINKKPFDAPRYERLAMQLRDLEAKERRAS